MASCNVCSNDIPASAIVAGKYKKVDGKTMCLSCASGGTQQKASATATKPVAKAPARASASSRPPAKKKAAPAGRPGSAGRATGARAGAKPAGRPAPQNQRRSSGGAAARRSEAAAQEAENRKKLVQRAMMAAGGAIVLLAVIVYMVTGKLDQEEATKQAIFDKSSAALEKVMVYRQNNPKDFSGQLKIWDEVEGDILKGGPDENQFRSLRARIVGEQQTEEYTKATEGAYETLNKNADNPDLIDENLKGIKELVGIAGGMDNDFREKVKVLADKINNNAIQFTLSNLQERIAQLGDNQIKEKLDEHAKARKFLSGMIVPGLVSDLVKKIVRARGQVRDAEYDLAEEYWSAKGETLTPLDLLSGVRAGMWKTAGPVKFNVSNGEMVVESTVGAGAKQRGTLITSTKDKWLDFVIEMDVSIASGGFEVVGRYSGPQNFLQRTFSTGGEGNPVKDGGRYVIRFYVIGGRNTLQADEKGPDGGITPMEFTNDTMPTPFQATNGGAFGLAIYPAGKVTVHSMTAKVLREDV